LLDYEAAVAALEEAVSELAREPDDLARSVRTYEEGLALARRCAHILKEAENRLRETAPPGPTPGT
jgi:exodeoxyribonuclease VII small subunit